MFKNEQDKIYWALTIWRSWEMFGGDRQSQMHKMKKRSLFDHRLIWAISDAAAKNGVILGFISACLDYIESISLLIV